MVIFGSYFFIYQALLPVMGKNSKNKGKGHQGGGKVITSQKASQGTNSGGTQVTQKQTPQVLTSLDQLATATIVRTPTMAAVEAPVAVVRRNLGTQTAPPVIEPPVAPVAVTRNSHHEGYVLESALRQDGSVKHTKVLVENNGVQDIILCFQPSSLMKKGSLIKFVPGTYEGRMTVTSPIIINENTPLAKFFEFVASKKVQAEIVEMSPTDLAKKFMSVNHSGKNEEERFNNFLAGQEILDIIGELPSGRLLVVK